MDRKKLLLLVGALAIAIVTAVMARSMFAGSSAPDAQAAPAVPQGPKVLVAQRVLPTGTIITADAIGFQPWPKELVKDAYYIDGESDVSKLLGTVVRFPVTAGEPVTQGSLVAPGDRGFLAAALGPGMRAVTVPVSAKTGVGGFIFPGDRVDLMLTQTVKSNGDSGDLKASETILRNIRVLATDQSTTQEKSENGTTVVKQFRTVTLEVTPKIAEKVAVAQTIGTLSLSLRSIADSQSELERAIAQGDVKIPDGATPEQEEKLLAAAMNRPSDGASTFQTGGDVSRFQRRTMPAPAPAMGAAPTISAAGPAPRGYAPAPAPRSVVTVTRGKDASTVTISRNGQVLESQAGAIQNGGQVVSGTLGMMP
ncbi:Flp pilus assembly protein CpaB [Parafrankia sp. BMG5.11]|uniref:Flp pilus assembly protein CpaB n=1 Tax=Parafrankia sp. BMG5.11 TaxID=222540 RepID=UPI001039BD8C|nr:Flp pilus assembly protein CpaB [Parafrankia sp. BMG5.11]TCJ38924.1 Flp pilus assembly protein CpaB [Parafrankia sp. BMG5.11]